MIEHKTGDWVRCNNDVVDYTILSIDGIFVELVEGVIEPDPYSIYATVWVEHELITNISAEERMRNFRIQLEKLNEI